jgi:hypothetical protein
MAKVGRAHFIYFFPLLQKIDNCDNMATRKRYCLHIVGEGRSKGVAIATQQHV